MTVRQALSSQRTLLGSGEYCSADPRLLDALDIERGGQIRIRRSDEEYAVYTVHEVREEARPEIVRVGELGRERLGTSGTFDGTASTPVPRSDISDNAAERDSEFVERLRDSGENQVVVSAPHGGWIERHTDRQAEYVADRLAGTTAWRCKGWQDGGGAFDRWHVSSTDLHPDSFPLLGSIADRGFQYSVSFHGFSGDGVVIGGDAREPLKQAVRTAIDHALPDRIDVRLATGGSYGGDSPANLVNWLAAEGRGGIQIEAGFAARVDHWQPIADAVISVLEPRL
ncbi:MAG: poly-gamma-glutamate hydrolase family protein [Halovenus sp.]